jgi:REP element-mobilizing transposase RayT
MARPLRIEFSGALYHITSRGNDRCPIYCDGVDRLNFLEQLTRGCNRYSWLCHAYCLMTNHYHLLVETQEPTLSKGMKYLNGSYTQCVNKRHARTGHLFQGRFKSVLVDSDAYLLELARYIVLNPVRARMVHSAEDWAWSSYRATAGMTRGHTCLTTDWVLAGFGSNKRQACEQYRDFVASGKGQPSPWESLKNQVYLGSEQFVEDMLGMIQPEQSLRDIPKPQKRAPPKPLEFYESLFNDRKLAMATAYLSGHYTLEEVGRQFKVSYATVSRAVKAQEENVKCKA